MAMAQARSRKIITLNYVWHDGEEAWLMTFDLTDVNGRAQCVGMSIRSYLAIPGHDPDTPDAEFRVWVRSGEPISDVLENTLETDLREGLKRALREQRAIYDELLKHELGALSVQADQELGEPRPLRAATLRRLPFGDALERARRQRIGDLQQFAASDLGRSDLSGTPVMEKAQARLSAEVASLSQPRTASGRRREYLPADLERVAAVYREAYDGGSPSPTKDVAETLGISRSQAGKLVMRCRSPEVHLLAPTTQSKAGGTRLSTTEGPLRVSGQDAAISREEQP
jgi:hypothetical protein